jgi:hypothetical protein
MVFEAHNNVVLSWEKRLVFDVTFCCVGYHIPRAAFTIQFSRVEARRW